MGGSSLDPEVPTADQGQKAQQSSVRKPQRPPRGLLFSRVDEEMIWKIWNGKYVELGELLQKEIKDYEDERKEYQLVCDDDGKFKFVPKKVIKEIKSVEKWHRAFNIYMAVYASKYPEKLYQLVEYADSIARFAEVHDWDRVSSYDKQYRQCLENLQRSWGELDEFVRMHLHQEVFLFGADIDRQESSPEPDREACRRFNRGIQHNESYCRYDHRCTTCGERDDHGAYCCPQKFRLACKP